MKVLELFKGTGSVGKTITKSHPDWEITSLDIQKKFNPDICCDIMDWDYKQFPVHHFDIIWASPECKIYSSLQDSLNWKRHGKTHEESKINLEQKRRDSDKFVLRALEIIEYFQPTKWFIENPWNSNMKTIPELQKLNSSRFDYCRFGFDYQKPTRIWSNVEFESMKCNCFENAEPKEKKEHKVKIGQHRTKDKKNPDQTTEKERYAIPEGLIEHLVEAPKPRKHKVNIGSKGTQSTNENQRYAIPERLVEHLVNAPKPKKHNRRIGQWKKEVKTTEECYSIPEQLISHLVDSKKVVIKMTKKKGITQTPLST